MRKKNTPQTNRKMTSKRVSVKITDTTILEQPLFYQPLCFYGKNLKPSFLQKIQKLKLPPL